MRFLEQLLRNLSKIVDEAYGCIPLERIVNAEYVDIALKKRRLEEGQITSNIMYKERL